MPRHDRRTPPGRRPAPRLERLEDRQLLSTLSNHPDLFGPGREALRPRSWIVARAEHARARGLRGVSTPDARSQAIVDLAAPSAAGGPPANAYVPAQIRKAYGFDQIPEQGQGLTIAIVDAFDDPNIAPDLSVFSATFGLPQMDGLDGDPTFAKAFPQGTPAPDTSWGGEISLDVEWVHALAPLANILLVETVDATNVNLYAGANSGVNFAKAQPGVVVVSNSYGGPEFPGELADDANFLPLAGLPVAITYGSGDGGAASRYPAASPNVIAAGGTFLQTASASGRYGIESGWSNGGGGLSPYEPRPAFQDGLPYGDARTFPDVAFDAAPNTGVAVYNTFSNNGWSRIGGNSFASPSWASIIALADQARMAGGLPALTSAGVHSALYADYNSANYPNDFHDITTGNNGYPAGPGYDLVTGIGTPKVPGVVQTLAAAP